MNKQFTKFRAYVPANFRGLMIQHWMKEERRDRHDVIRDYVDDEFEEFSKRIANTFQEFIPDLGYSNQDEDGRWCFEVADNNFVIPVSILEPVHLGGDK